MNQQRIMSMFFYHKSVWVSIFLIGLSVLSVESNAQITTPVIKFNEGMDINEWMVTGPFDSDSDASLVDEDLLLPLGMAEDKNADILSMGLSLGASSAIRQKAIRVSDGLVDLQHVFEREHTDLAGIKQSGGYLDCIIESDVEQNAYLSIGNADAAKIWLNGNLIVRFEGLTGVETYDDCVRIRLKAGPNLLRAKVMNVRNGRGIAAHLEKQVNAAARVAMRGMRIRPPNLLTRVFVDSRTPLVMWLRGVPKEFSCGASVLDLDEKLILELSPKDVSGAGWVPTLPVGVYIYRIIVGGEKYDEPFCVGQSEKVFMQIKEGAAPFLDQTPRGHSLAGCIRRLEILLDPKTKPARFSYAWDRRILFAMVNAARIIQAASRGDKDNLRGLQIRGFKSKIDDQVQFYRLYIPERIDSEDSPLPLVVFVPTAVSANRPFIQSPFMVAQSEAERIAAIAERYRMAVVWCGYRNQPRGIPTELTHVDEVLDDINALHAIDSGRIFLCGACSGGAISSFYALHRPGRYAGIGLLNPVFGLHWSVVKHVDFTKFASFSEYNSECEMAPALLEKTKIPILLINDGAEPGHGDLSISEDFAKLARQNQYPLEFEIRAKPRMQHFDAWERFFVWFSAAAARSTPSGLPSFWRDDTIMAGLARRFIVVEGTRGTEQETQIIQKISGQIQAAWKQTQHGPCRVVRDVDFKDVTDPGSTIVLIGNRKTNRIWDEMAPPVALGTKRIRIYDQEWSGERLSFIATIPNPAMESGSIILVGAADLNDAGFCGLDIGTEGWFSFAVFGTVADTRKLLDAGRWVKAGQLQAAEKLGD